jgi:cell division septation protein DedD
MENVMPRNEEGEFELVLGNRQLLSVFFIVVVLLGVFFTMGYILGRNAAPLAPAVTQTASPKPLEVSAVPKDTTASPAPVQPPVEVKSPAAEPAKPSPAGEPIRTEAQKPEPPKATPPQPAAQAPAAPASIPGLQTGKPPVGAMFLQVAAVKRPEAELVGEVLTKKGFPAWVAPTETEGIYRVMVGPLKDTAEISKAKAGLQESGFQPFLRKIQ